jgi:hypothetical protein
MRKGGRKGTYVLPGDIVVALGEQLYLDVEHEVNLELDSVEHILT